jgi:hypothetical protein
MSRGDDRWRGGSYPSTIPAREKTKGPTPKSRALSDLGVCQISDVVICQRLHVEAEFDHDTTRRRRPVATDSTVALSPEANTLYRIRCEDTAKTGLPLNRT